MQNFRNMGDFINHIEGYNMNGVCVACLAHGRKMFALTEASHLLRFLADIEVPVGVSVQLCWECTASAVAVKRFGNLVKNSFKILKEYSRKNPSLLAPSDLSGYHTPRLTIFKCHMDNMASPAPTRDKHIRDDAPAPIKVEKEDSIEYVKHEIERRDLMDETSDDTVCNYNYNRESDAGLSVTPNDIQTEERMVVKVNPEDIIEAEYDSVYLNLATQVEFQRPAFVQNDWTPRKKKKKKVENKNMTLICEFCGKKFNDRVYIIRHLRKHTGVGSSNCDICMKKFATNGHLEKHYMMHAGIRPYVCEICTKSFIQKQSLIDHQMLHTGEKPHKCGECNKSFIRKRGLQDHRCNGKSPKFDRPHTCHVCDKEFRFRRHLEAHVSMHTGERPYACNVCEKAFTRADILNQHKISHTRVKIHNCNVCTKTFKYKSGLANHVRMHNNEKPFACHLCGKKFLRNVYLTEHLERHSNPNSRIHHNTPTVASEAEKKTIDAIQSWPPREGQHPVISSEAVSPANQTENVVKSATAVKSESETECFV